MLKIPGLNQFIVNTVLILTLYKIDISSDNVNFFLKEYIHKWLSFNFSETKWLFCKLWEMICETFFFFFSLHINEVLFGLWPVHEKGRLNMAFSFKFSLYRII